MIFVMCFQMLCQLLDSCCQYSLKKIQEALKTKNIIFTYTEEDNCGSLDFQFRGLRYHIWEFVDGEESGVETNVYHAGKSEDITGDYETEISELILSWPDMAIPG